MRLGHDFAKQNGWRPVNVADKMCVGGACLYGAWNIWWMDHLMGGQFEQDLMSAEQLVHAPTEQGPLRYTPIYVISAREWTREYAPGNESLGAMRGQDLRPQAARPPYRFFDTPWAY
jgi:hypothetical protein